MAAMAAILDVESKNLKKMPACITIQGDTEWSRRTYRHTQDDSNSSTGLRTVELKMKNHDNCTFPFNG